jgi:hypothetical protein
MNRLICNTPSFTHGRTVRDGVQYVKHFTNILTKVMAIMLNEQDIPSYLYTAASNDELYISQTAEHGC